MARPSGVVNPIYESTFVFTNDFPALLEDEPQPEESFVKTKVDSYLGFTTPLGLATPGHSGLFGSNSESSDSSDFST